MEQHENSHSAMPIAVYVGFSEQQKRKIQDSRTISTLASKLDDSERYLREMEVFAKQHFDKVRDLENRIEVLLGVAHKAKPKTGFDIKTTTREEFVNYLTTDKYGNNCAPYELKEMARQAEKAGRIDLSKICLLLSWTNKLGIVGIGTEPILNENSSLRVFRKGKEDKLMLRLFYKHSPSECEVYVEEGDIFTKLTQNNFGDVLKLIDNGFLLGVDDHEFDKTEYPITISGMIKRDHLPITTFKKIDFVLPDGLYLGEKAGFYIFITYKDEEYILKSDKCDSSYTRIATNVEVINGELLEEGSCFLKNRRN